LDSSSVPFGSDRKYSAGKTTFIVTRGNTNKNIQNIYKCPYLISDSIKGSDVQEGTYLAIDQDLEVDDDITYSLKSGMH